MNKIFPGLSREEYDRIDAINISLLIEGERSMGHLNYAAKNGRPSTDAMERGTALHLAVFEPAKFETKVTYYPHPSSEGKIRRGAEWEKFKGSREEDLILLKSNLDSVIEMRDALYQHERAKELLNAKGHRELAVVWTDEETGLPCKGLIDSLRECWGYSIILDLKSTVDARPLEFAKQCYNLGMHTKAAWYLDGLNLISPVPRRFLWLAIESVGYHGINIFDASEDMLQSGRRNYRRLLNQYAECKKTGVWPGYELGESEISLPKWAKE